MVNSTIRKVFKVNHNCTKITTIGISDPGQNKRTLDFFLMATIHPWWTGRGKEVFRTFNFSFPSSLPLPVLKMPWIVKSCQTHSADTQTASMELLFHYLFFFQQFYYYDVFNIKDRKVYRGVADCFNLVFITCGINLMISAHCTNAATKPDTLYYVL